MAVVIDRGGAGYERIKNVLTTSVRNALDGTNVLVPFGQEERIAAKIVNDIIRGNMDDLRQLVALFKADR